MKSTAKLVEGCFQSIVGNGGHHGIVLDLPGANGGQDVAPTAPELAVVAKNSLVSYRKVTSAVSTVVIKAQQ